MDRLLIEGRSYVRHRETRRSITGYALIADDAPRIFLTVPESLPVVHKKIIGVQQAPAGIGWNFEEWYIPKPGRRT